MTGEKKEGEVDPSVALRATSICLGTNPEDFKGRPKGPTNWDGVCNQKDKSGKSARSRSPSPVAKKSPRPRSPPHMANLKDNKPKSEMKIRYTDPKTRELQEPEEAAEQ